MDLLAVSSLAGEFEKDTAPGSGDLISLNPWPAWNRFPCQTPGDLQREGGVLCVKVRDFRAVCHSSSTKPILAITQSDTSLSLCFLIHKGRMILIFHDNWWLSKMIDKLPEGLGSWIPCLLERRGMLPCAKVKARGICLANTNGWNFYSAEQGV